MSRLDQHVAAVQNKLALGKFVGAVVWTSAIFALVVWVAIVIDRVFLLRLPHWPIWFWAGVGAAGVAAMTYAIWRRPDVYAAAIRIDDVLHTKDKFATALHVRTVNDPFAHAALLDAERTAESVNLHKKFPLTTPRKLYVPIVIVAIALGTHLLLKPMDVFGRKDAARKQIEAQAKVEQANKTLQNALAVVSAVPPALQQNEQIKVAKEGLLQQLNQPLKDPARAERTAAKALQDVSEAIKEQIKQNQKYAEAQNEAKMLRTLQVPQDEKGPVADAQRELAKGNFQDAVSELNKVAENFDKMSKKDQEKAAEQMQNMANQLKQMANNPQPQQQMQQQLQQQLGLNQQQAQQLQQQMQKAAQGDKQAQQQLQQMAQQAMKQMNNGQGPNKDQQQQIQQAMQQMQAQANAKQNAQNMQQAAQQMAKAMQQMQQQQAQPGQQGQQGQKAQQGQQQQGQQQGQQQMAQGMQQMQQQMQQMQAAAQDAQQIAGAQQAAQNAAQQAMDAMNGQGQNGQQQGQGNQPGQGQNPGGGDPNQPWNGQANDGMQPNNGGQGAGDRSGKKQAPYAVKPEMSPSIDDEKGKILASTLVKGAALKGESKEQLKEVVENAIKNSADEIDQDRVSRQAQRVVRDYFSSIQNDTATAGAGAAAPTTAPAK
ncbi:hypothetical protein BH09PLA1_BH09PLA1_19380 [soil metagenome]